jgi:ATP-dependent RNA helicase MSS116
LRQQAAAEQPVQQRQKEIIKFDQLIEQDLVHPNVINAITGNMGLDTMTEVQSKTINETLDGIDV